MKKNVDYKVADKPKTQGRPPVWNEVREVLKTLPDKKSLVIPVPKGRTVRQFSDQVRNGITGKKEFRVSVSEKPSENAVYVWEKREPYNQIEK